MFARNGIVTPFSAELFAWKRLATFHASISLAPPLHVQSPLILPLKPHAKSRNGIYSPSLAASFCNAYT